MRVKKRLSILRTVSIVCLVFILAASAMFLVPRVGAAVAFRSSNVTQNSTATSSITLNTPSGVVSGDLLLVVITARGGTDVTITPPTGWTLLPGSDQTSTTVIRSAMFYQIYSSGSNFAFTFGGSTPSQKAVGVISAYSGVDPANPINATTSVAKAAAAPMAANAVTTTVANTMLVTAFGIGRSNTPTSTTGNTMRGATSTSGGNATTNTSVGLQDYNTIQAVAGASAAPQMNPGTAAVYIAHTVAIQPDNLIVGQSNSQFFNIGQTGELGAVNNGIVPEQTPFSMRSLLTVDGRTMVKSERHFKLQAALKSGVCSVFSDVQLTATSQNTYPTSATNDSSTGLYAWSNVGGATVNDGSYANIKPPLGAPRSYDTNIIRTSGYGFSIPANATIFDIKVVPSGYYTNGPTIISQSGATSYANLVVGGATRPTPASGYLPASVERGSEIGSFAPEWVDGVTPADVNSSSFGVALWVNAYVDSSFSGDAPPSVYMNSLAVKVQYSLPSTGSIVYEVSSVPVHSTAITGNSNDPATARTVNIQSYVKAPQFTNDISSIPAGQDGLWDFRLYGEAGVDGKTYCLRVVNMDGSLLNSYSTLPEITFSADSPVLAPSVEQQLRGGQAIREGQPDTPLVGEGQTGW